MNKAVLGHTLTPELSNFVNEMVEGGCYASISEVMRQCLRALHELEHGEGIPGDPEVVLGEALKVVRSRLT